MQNVFNLYTDILNKIWKSFVAKFVKYYIVLPPKISIAMSVVFKQCLPIFIVCFLVSVSVAGERPKLLNCRSMNKESFVKEYPESVISKNLLSGNLYLCRSENGSDLGSSTVKLGDANIFFYSGDSQPMVDEGTNKISKNPTKGRTGNIFYNLFHDPTFTFVIGGIFSSVILGAVFFYTQP